MNRGWNRFLSWLTQLVQPPTADKLADRLQTWYQTPYGKRIIAQQKVISGQWLGKIHGYRAMQLAVVRGEDLLDDATMLHRFSLSNLADDNSVGAIIDFDALPLPSNLVDVALMHHVLDYCALPHEALKEAARVVAPSGYLIVVGFNPLGWIGLLKWPMRLLTGSVLWRCRSLSPLRVYDWLRLLGFQTEAVTFCNFALPLPFRRFQSLMDRLKGPVCCDKLPLGAFYVIVARKQVLRPLDNQGPAWIPRAVKPLQFSEKPQMKPANRKRNN